ncbi:hypothetical protein ACA910_017797 [Epithemia clementina (nom. ined.)]
MRYCSFLLASLSTRTLLRSPSCRQQRLSSVRECIRGMASVTEKSDTDDDDDKVVLLTEKRTHRLSNNNSSNAALFERWIRHDNLDFHKFSKEEATEIRSRLLSWYSENRRKLPWRGDPPPWVGSTVNFGKSSKSDATTRTTEKTKNIKKRTNHQLTIKDYFKPAKSSDPTSDADDIDVRLEGHEDLAAFPVSAYGVWVSEIMLQQTRVEAVIPYWIRWMKSFPTVYALAAATEDEVNSHWAGLGFYRRARLLHSAAKQIVDDYNGQIPDTVDGLQKLPGIGRYTACAIASIAYNVTVPVVDGNVCRVLARLKGIANDVKAPALKDRFGWDLAADLVKAGGGARPGELNQALMELGATYCAPSGTGTEPNDPLRDFYYSTRLGREVARRQSTTINMGDGLYRYGKGCPVCTDNGTENAQDTLIALLLEEKPNKAFDIFASECGHKTFPLPPKKNAKREEVLAVAVLSCKIDTRKNDGDTAWLLTRRPRNGLLAGQWEFPSSIVCTSDDDATNTTTKKGNKRNKNDHEEMGAVEVPKIPARKRKKALDHLLLSFKSTKDEDDDATEEETNVLLANRSCLDNPLEHIFSHVRHTMWIEHANIDDSHHHKLTNEEMISSTTGCTARWMTESDMQNVGVTSGVKKILNTVRKATVNNNKQRPGTSTATSTRRRKRIKVPPS